MNMTLKFGAVDREPDVRFAQDMADVILDKEWLEKNKKAELYYMYRDLWREGDKEVIHDHGLRYDITVIPPLKMGNEFVKTKGHYHPETSDGLSYPEIYEVLEGRAHYLLQKESEEEVKDVILIEAEKGEKALIPPNYGHITINPSKETLKMANWVDRGFDSIYGDIVDLKGGAYFELTSGEFIKNKNYDHIPEMRKEEPVEIPEIDIVTGEDMYNLINNPKKLEFLSNPRRYEEIFASIY